MSAAPALPVPFFEGAEKRVEIRYALAAGADNHNDNASRGNGLRDVPVAVWSASLAKAGITIENSIHGPEWDCYMLSESSLFVSKDRIICKTCGRSAPLAIIEDAVKCGLQHGAEARLVLFSRSDLLRPSEQASVHQSFDSERAFLEAALPHATANAYTFGDTYGAHWTLYVAALPTTADASGAVQLPPPTLEIAMYGLGTLSTSVWWQDQVGTAAAARKLSGLQAVMPQDGCCIIDEMLFAPCGYSMNCFDDRNAHATVHVTPQEGCSFASYECAVLDPSTVNDTIRTVVDVFKPERFSVSLVDFSGRADLFDINPTDGGSGFGYATAALCSQMLSCDGITGRQVFGTFISTQVGSDASNVLDDTVMLHHPDGCSSADVPATQITATLGNTALRTLLAARAVPITDPLPLSQMFAAKINEHALDAPFYIANIGAVEARFMLWKALLPRVEPLYAVKCNPDEVMMPALNALGCGFDIASKEELRLAFKAGATPERVVFANPVKSVQDMKYARQHGIGLTTFDSAAELHKLAEHWPEAGLLLRIATDDSGATCRLSNKYGAWSGAEVSALIDLARDLDLNLVGVAFHCGSGQSQSTAFCQPILDAAAVFNEMNQAGFHPHVLDIGGGFPGGSDAASGGGSSSDGADGSFAEITTVINAMLDAHFPDETIRVIAEPGRFFAHSAFSLACNILGKKDLAEVASEATHLASPQQQVTGGVEEEDAQVSYTIGDGIYGSFNSLLYDHAVAHPIPLVLGEETYSSWKPATVFGPTCDGLDRVCSSVLLPAGLRPGRDWLLFEDMGAYTLAAGSSFNGIQRADVHYIYSTGSTLEAEKQAYGQQVGLLVPAAEEVHEIEPDFKTEEVRPAVHAEYEIVAAAGAAGQTRPRL